MKAHVQQLYTNCLAQAAYYVSAGGRAAVIDPIREPEPYLELARQRGESIAWIFETHFHADFVSGHQELARLTGAQLVFGPGAQPDFEVHVAHDGERFELAPGVGLRVLHTPGHTLESSCFLLEEDHQPKALFTGDTLFIGDVGRPDLAVKSNLTQEDLAGMLYDSLHNAILPLPDDVVVYPGHGAGSACGKNIGAETWDTLGHQRQTNYALKPMTREEFVRELTTGIAPPPAYFAENARLNKSGTPALQDVMASSLNALSVNALKHEMERGAWVLDARAGDTFALAFVPGSINIGLDGQYAVWVGAVVPFNQRLVLVVDAGREREAVLRLARVGYHNVAGFLEGGIEAWKAAGQPLDHIENLEPQQVPACLAQGCTMVDVRRPGEYETGHLEAAQLRPLDDFGRGATAGLDPQTPTLVHCAGGYRSLIAASWLRRQGFARVMNVRGGFAALRTAGVLPVATGAPARVR